MILPVFYSVAANTNAILPDGALSADWFLIAVGTLMILVIGYLLNRFINQMDKLTTEVAQLRLDHTTLRRDFDSKYHEDYVEGQNARIAEIIYAKIKAITPPHERNK